MEKCGPNTAAKWLNAWNDLEGVMANAPDMKGKIGEYLREALETLPLSRDLATIRGDLDLEEDVTQLTRGPVNEAALREFLQHNEFNSWLRELGAGDESQQSKVEPKYTTILEMAAFKQWLERLEQSDLVAFDTETTSLDPMRADLVGLSFAVEPGEAIYVPVGHDYAGAPAQLPLERVLEVLGPLHVINSIKAET